MPVLVAMGPVIVIILLITLFSWRHLRGRSAGSGSLTLVPNPLTIGFWLWLACQTALLF